MAHSAEAGARVGDIYRQVLGREVDAGGLADARGILARGGSLSEVRAAVARSAEARAAAADLYRRALGREAVPDELAGVQDGLARGGSLEAVRVNMAGSAEAQARVSGVFEAVLGRAPEAANAAWMGDVLARGGSVAEVRAGLASSAEAAGAIRGVYLQVLGRDAEAAGVSHWQERLAGGLSLAEVRAALASSAEAAARVPPAGGTGPASGGGPAAPADGTTQSEPSYPLVEPHPAPDGGESWTNLSDADYYRFKAGLPPESAPPATEAAGSGDAAAQQAAVQRAGEYAAWFGRGVMDALGEAARSAWDTAQAVVRLFDDGDFRRQVADGAARLARLDAEITASVLTDPLGTAGAVADGVQSLYDRFQAARSQAARDGGSAAFDGRFAGRVLTEGALAFVPLGTVAKLGRGVELSRGTELAEVAGRLAVRSERAAGLL